MLRGATVLDGLGGRIANARVVIRDHRVAEVSLDDDRVAVPEGATVEDVRGRFLIPGLFDSHVHWGGSGGVGSSPIEQTDDRLSHDYGATLAAGVTSVVSLTDDVAAMEKLSIDVGAARRNAPRTFYSGPSVTARGGHPAAMFGFMPGLAEMLTRQVETPDEARAAIAELDRRRVDLVKLVLEPGFPGRGLPKLKDEVFLAAMAEAKSRRMRTTVHVGTDADARLAIEAGANGLEHTARGLERRHHRDDGREEGDLHADAGRARLGVEARRHSRRGRRTCGAWRCRRSCSRCSIPSRRSRRCCPKARWPRPWPARSRDRCEQVRRAIKAGVPILAGSDGGNPATFHGISLVRELELLAQAGMPLTEVLQGRNVARRGPPRSIITRPHLRGRGGRSRAARRRSHRRRARLSPRRLGVPRRPQNRSRIPDPGSRSE